MAALFDLVKHPELVEQRQAEESLAPEVAQRENQGQEPAPSTLPPEIRQLRGRAMVADASLHSGEHLLSEIAQDFLQKCLESGAQAAEAPQAIPPTPDHQALYPSFLLRQLSVPLMVGDWPTVLSAREAAIAVARELSRRSYAGPIHRFDRDGAYWTLRIEFGY